MPCTIQFCTVQFSFALLYSLQVEISLGGVGIDVVDSDDGDVGDDDDDENGERVRISVGIKGKTSLISIFIKSSLSPRLHISTSPHLYFLCQMHVGNIPISDTKNTQ